MPIIDLDAASGFTPTTGSAFELLRATSIGAIPTLVHDGDAFDAASLSIRVNADGSRSLVATVPEPASLMAIGLHAVAGLRRRAVRRVARVLPPPIVYRRADVFWLAGEVARRWGSERRSAGKPAG